MPELTVDRVRIGRGVKVHYRRPDGGTLCNWFVEPADNDLVEQVLCRRCVKVATGVPYYLQGP